ncbi:MAG: DUF2793 domain-containing protein [Rhizobiales bacterium]|nr:DUF2793 domain-containing protein [Hyphomicrobiales bacterium]
MSETTNLALPLMEAAQAQKHVTHNETLRCIDTLLQLAVLEREIGTPPGAPLDGQRWIVQATPSPTGAWAGHGNHIAAWQDGAWQFSVPRVGWVAYVVDENALVIWDGSAWSDVALAMTELQNLVRLGVGTTADATNPFSAKLNNALWVARTSAEGGDGDLRYKMSKESAAKTLSLLFQDNFSGRAEIGLTGDDDLHVKVSPDGSSWIEALTIDTATGRVSFPAIGGPRECLMADRTYYVRTDGDDANSGRANTAGGAFLTIQKAIDTVASLDLGVRQATIQLANGVHTGALTLRPYLGGVPPIIRGNATTPANTRIDAATTTITNDGGGLWIVRDVKITGSSHGLYIASGGTIKFANIDFGACGSSHAYVDAGGILTAIGSYAVSGNAARHVTVVNGVAAINGVTITYSNSPAFSLQNLYAGGAGLVNIISVTFTNGGTVTGTRYRAENNGAIFTNGGSASYLPGSVAGTTSAGGVYA